MIGGGGGIRTRVGLTTPKVFETWPIDHSDTPPMRPRGESNSQSLGPQPNVQSIKLRGQKEFIEILS